MPPVDVGVGEEPMQPVVGVQRGEKPAVLARLPEHVVGFTKIGL